MMPLALKALLQGLMIPLLLLLQVLIHYKRCFKVLKLLKETGGRVLVLGSRRHHGLGWLDRAMS